MNGVFRRFLLSKIHRAAVTDTSADYEGSMEVDLDILNAAAMVPGEMVHVFNITNGERFETYLIAGAAGSRSVILNGAAAHKGAPGDRLIILTHALTDGAPPTATVIVLDEHNNVISKK